jgi:hypothetical protein
MVASFGEERGATVLTREGRGGGGVRTTVVAHTTSDREGSAVDNVVGRALFITSHSVIEGRCPGWLIGMRHVATQRPTGGPHMSAKFQFLEIPENMFPRSKNR